MKLLFSFVLSILLFSVNAYSQQDSNALNLILEKKTKYANEHPIEKVYLHFDKPYYAIGDTIWFKAYLTMDQHIPSTLSKIVYVDIITDQDSVVESLKLQVTNSVTAGSIVLKPLSYKQGNYRVRAYTNWMFNFKEDYFFYKTLTVGDAIEKQLITHIAYLKPGDKSSKVNARVAFKDQDGRPLTDRKLTWKIMLGYDVISKGKAQTDSKGIVEILVPDYKKASLSTGILSTSIELNSTKLVSSQFPLAKAFESLDLQFFPEGGEFIEGIPSKVAFKAIQTNGLGVDVKGIITDNNDVTVTEFTSQHLGMGVFILVPEAGKTYKAIVSFADGSKTTYLLPVVSKTGINIKCSDTNTESINVRITCNEAFLEKFKGSTFNLIGQSSNVIAYAAQLRLMNLLTKVTIPKSKFPSGVAQLSLLSAAGLPLTERLMFVYHGNELNVVVKTDKTAYAAKQKVKLNITAQHKLQPAQGNFSVAVINESMVPFDQNSATTIITSLLLNSELKGYIEKPNYYFTNISDKTQEDLDILMLTQGYRHLSYQSILQSQYPAVTFLPEQGIDISGTLRLKNGMPVFKGNIRLIIADKAYGQSAVTNADGKFVFKNILVSDSSKVTLSALNNVNSKNMILTVDGTAFPAVTKNNIPAEEILNIDSTYKVYLDNSKRQYFKSRMLQEVVIKSKVIEKKSSHSDYSSLSGLSMLPNSEINSQSFKGCLNFLTCLQASAMGLIYTDHNFFIGKDYMAGNKTPVQFFLRDMPIDVNQLNSINPAEVESVEIFFKDDLSGINRKFNTNGVVVINVKEVKKSTLKLADLKELFPSPNSLTFMPVGYSKLKQFYTPKYPVNPINLPVNDWRTTVYWNPFIFTDTTGNAAFEFYNSDTKGTYSIIVEGIDKDGTLARSVYRYSVK